MGKKLSKAPVCFTLAQIQFEPGDDEPGLYDALREALLSRGYDEAETIPAATFEVQMTADGVVATPKMVVRQWFYTRGRTSGIMLDPVGLTYQTTDYPVFTKFSDAFIEAIEVVHALRPIRNIQRIGMRMLDVIRSQAGDRLDDYLVSGTIGIVDSIRLPIPLIQGTVEAIFQEPPRTLIVRAVRSPAGVPWPEDLSPNRLRLAARFEEMDQPAVLVDTDAFRADDMGPIAGSRERLESELQALKALLSAGFKQLTTEHALKVWQ
jgi:uncharacterized protein (TIGR04255 family)